MAKSVEELAEPPEGTNRPIATAQKWPIKALFASRRDDAVWPFFNVLRGRLGGSGTDIKNRGTTGTCIVVGRTPTSDHRLV
jgi:hypothetical protein